MKVWFAGCATYAEGKRLYNKLCKDHHPDRQGGDLRTMQEINAEWQRFKREHRPSAASSSGYNRQEAPKPPPSQDYTSGKRVKRVRMPRGHRSGFTRSVPLKTYQYECKRCGKGIHEDDYYPGSWKKHYCDECRIIVAREKNAARQAAYRDRHR